MTPLRFLEKCIHYRLLSHVPFPGPSLHVQFFACNYSLCVRNFSNRNDVSPQNGIGKKIEPVPELSERLIHHLERTSLVDFDNTEAVSRLSEAINFANQLLEVNTDGIEPLVSVLENEALYLRDDKPETCNRKEILSNASITEEDYFVAPPGNVPLEPTSKLFKLELEQRERNTS